MAALISFSCLNQWKIRGRVSPLGLRRTRRGSRGSWSSLNETRGLTPSFVRGVFCTDTTHSTVTQVFLLISTAERKNEDERNWRVAPPERSVNASSLYSVTYSEREVKLNFVALSLIRKICITLAAPNAERLANEV